MGKRLRFLLKEGERKPDPPPVQTDDRLAILTGLLLWIVALAIILVVTGVGQIDIPAHWFWTCVSGIGLGLIGLVYISRRHTKQKGLREAALKEQEAKEVSLTHEDVSLPVREENAVGEEIQDGVID